jgi:hypothetical protein
VIRPAGRGPDRVIRTDDRTGGKFINPADDARSAKGHHQPMSFSPHTYAALSYAREQDLRHAARRHQAMPCRDVVESAPSVGRLRRRLAQMHLTTPAQAA